MSRIETIAVFYGSDSSEWEVACRSGEFTASNIDDTRYNIYEVFARFGKWQLAAYRKKNSMRVTFPEGARPEIDKTDCSVRVLGEKVKFDYVYIMQHGAPGETGLLQGYFEMLGIPFSSCSAFVSTVAFDKFACKTFMRDVNIPMAKDVYLRRGDSYSVETIAEHLGLPVFVKPSDGGSSFGITKVKRIEDLDTAIKSAFEEGETVLLEQFIEGRELTQGVYFDGNDIVPLPITEIISHNEYFDYDAKYNGKSDEICPADIPQEVAATVSKYTCRIYHHFGCMGIVRCDYIVRPDGKVFFLEINTVPGMTKMSLVPAQIKAAGLNLSEILDNIISQASGK